MSDLISDLHMFYERPSLRFMQCSCCILVTLIYKYCIVGNFQGIQFHGFRGRAAIHEN